MTENEEREMSDSEAYRYASRLLQKYRNPKMVRDQIRMMERAIRDYADPRAGGQQRLRRR